MTFGSKSPLFVRKVAFHSFSSLIYRLLYLQIRSSLLKYLAFLSLLITSLIKSSNVLFFIIYYLSLKCRNIVLYILNLIPRFILPWAVHPTINLILYSSLLLLHRSWCLILWMLSLLGLSYGPILVFPVISSCWINMWKVKCTLEGPLSLSDLVPFLFCIVLFLDHPFVEFFCY